MNRQGKSRWKYYPNPPVIAPDPNPPLFFWIDEAKNIPEEMVHILKTEYPWTTKETWTMAMTDKEHGDNLRSLADQLSKAVRAATDAGLVVTMDTSRVITSLDHEESEPVLILRIRRPV